jgi:hypothetical protein
MGILSSDQRSAVSHRRSAIGDHGLSYRMKLTAES